MAQIKITVTDEEKKKYEDEARKSGLSLSKYMKAKLNCRNVLDAGKLPEPIFSDNLFTGSGNQNRQPGQTHISLRINSALAGALKQQAKDLGLSLQDYISLLLIQKGKPVIIQFYADYQAELSLWFLDWMRDIETIADAARISGGALTKEEIDQAIMDFKDAATDFRTAAKRIDRKLESYISDLNQKLNFAKEQ